MTGFGRGEVHGPDHSVTVDLRSVNHRFLDVHVRVPGKYPSWEPRARAIVRETLSRGKVDVYVNVKEWGGRLAGARLNLPLLSAVAADAREGAKALGIPPDITLSDLLRLPDALVPPSGEGEDPAEALWGDCEAALREGIGRLEASREAEGEELRRIVGAGVERLSAVASDLARLAAENREAAVVRFRERIAALAGEAGVDAARLHQEAAFLVDRLDVTEETDRLRLHLAALADLVERPAGPVGKRFDFLVQEAFRELNTTGSKSAHAGVSERVVEGKTELERVREQIQNVE
jgi:uncharacterized protein (TIGR00255 family)